MLDIKNIYKQTFKAIKSDEKLLDLLGVEYKGVDNNTFLTNLRKQITETSAPNGILNDYKTRLCIHEQSGGFNGKYEEVGFLAIDIHITKDNNAIDGRLHDIVKRVIEVIDTKQRKNRGLKPLDVGLYGLNYKRRIFDEKSNNTGWEKYTIIFEYRYIL